MTTNSRHSPLMDLVAKKQQAENSNPTASLPEDKPLVVGLPPEVPTVALLSPTESADQVADLLAAVQKLTGEAQQLQAHVQNLTAKITAAPAGPGAAGGLGQGNISKPMWVTDHAVDLLKSHTTRAWTRNKLMAIAVAKGWRSPEKGHKPVNHVFVTMITNRQYAQPTLVYTEAALQHIIDNDAACWQLATSVKL
jgi:hypothetical protein